MKSLATRLRPSVAGRRLAGDALWVGAEVLVSRGGTIVAMLMAARWLGPERFGGLVAVQGTVVLIASIISIGMRTAATTGFARLEGHDAERLLAVVTITTGLLATLLAAVTVTFATVIADVVLADVELASLLRLGGLLLLVDCITSLQLGILTGCRSLRPAAFGSTIAGVILVIAVFVGTRSHGELGAISGLAAGGLAGILLRGPATLRALRGSGIAGFRTPRAEDFRALGRIGLPMLAVNLLWTPATWVASMLLVRSPLGYAELGYLGAANQWFAVLMFLPNVLGFATLPALSVRAHEADRAALSNTILVALRTSMAVIVPLALAVALLSPWIMQIYGTAYRSAWPSLALLAIASIPATAIAVYTNVLTVLGRWRSMLLAQSAWIALYLGVTAAGLSLGAGAIALGAAMLAGNAARLVLSARAMRHELELSGEVR